MTNWIRKCQLTIETSESAAALPGSGVGGATMDLSNLRIKFVIYRRVVQTPNEGWFRIYNVNKTTAMRIIQASRQEAMLRLEAGYDDDFGLIYKGKMAYAATGRESPTDTFVDISCKDGGDATARATVNHTFPPDTKESDKVKYLIDQLKNDFGIEVGRIEGVSDDKDPQGQTMKGHIFDFLREVARSRGLQLYIENNTINMVPISAEGIGNIELSENTGLIGMPQVTTLGIIVTALINPKYKLNVKLQIKPDKINQMKMDPGFAGLLKEYAAEQQLGIQEGTYTIQSIEWRGDTRGEEWYAIMSCKGESASGSTAKYIPNKY